MPFIVVIVSFFVAVLECRRPSTPIIRETAKKLRET